jgi:hypothetical protein
MSRLSRLATRIAVALGMRAPEPVDQDQERDRLAALLADKERMLGPDHPDTLTTRLKLAAATGRAGDPAAGRDL